MTREEFWKRFDKATNEERTKLHQEYYGQFVTPLILSIVTVHVGRERLLSSTDPHFNDIPLPIWDRTPIGYVDDGSLASKVCVAKEAARQLCNYWRNGDGDRDNPR